MRSYSILSSQRILFRHIEDAIRIYCPMRTEQEVNMTYKRRIAYFDYIEYGEKKGNAGFCKWQQKNEIHNFEILINGLKEDEFKKVKIFTKTGSELGDMQLQNGHAMAIFSKKGDDGNWDWEFSRIRIPLSEERELVAEFPVERIEQQLVERDTQQSVEKKEEKDVHQSVEKREEKDVHQPVEKKEEEDVHQSAEKLERRTVHNPVEREEESVPISLFEWLEKTHEKICPYGTSEEYFRITIEDIYHLKEECHVLRNNQFLLHGYYNYKYLILGKKGGNSEEYWLGVPGIYHEREKMAARMYGFEKFEGTKPNYTVGDLGYYLITVK